MLIGADLYGAIILGEIKKGNADEPIAQKTVFGWVLSGSISSTVADNDPLISVHHCLSLKQLDSTITKFWDDENIPDKKLLSPEDEFCESHFLSTHSRIPDGRYMVRLPIKQSPPKISQSRFIAENCLKRN